MEMSSKVNILGSEWTIEKRKKSEDKGLTNCDGYCDYSVKLIIVEDFNKEETELNTLINLEIYQKQVIRHEIIHAFLHESGLAECSTWATNEEMVDYFAKQFEKLNKAFEEVEVLENAKCGCSKSLGEQYAEAKGIKMPKHPICEHTFNINIESNEKSIEEIQKNICNGIKIALKNINNSER
ncbi:hypothetical protein [uncultured Clostridium sp.]|uniref:hypothetical protein n=1 Tax=uncultured Clostridium sp. TaxID=59620 RepID=UPI0028E1D447|nr:hypothetical protein [uncultured Clostridium sp.]